jgi:diguanylate cyclase (GGDEF)-like protein
VGSIRTGRRPSTSALLDVSVFVLGLGVLVGALFWWRHDGVGSALLPALAVSIPAAWVLTRFPLMVTGATTGIYVPFAPVLLFFLLTLHGTHDAGTALLTWTVAALPAYLVDRRPWTSRVFNSGSSMLSALAATLVVVAVQPAVPVTPGQLVAVLAGAGTYYVVDALLSAISLAVERSRSLASELLHPGTAAGGALFLLVASIGYLSAAVDLSMPGWVTDLTVVPGASVVVAAWGWRKAAQRRHQQHELFRASVRVHAAVSRDELMAALEEHGSALVSGGRLQVVDRPPSNREIGCELPADRVAGPRWIVVARATNRYAQRFDDAAVEALGLLAAAALVRVRLVEEAERQALVDALTGLPNRRAFTAYLDRAVTVDAAIAVLFVDLDGFKAVNDTLGHGAGDELLAETARRLRAAAGPDGFAARLGGDEFAVVLPDTFPGAADDTATAIVAALCEPFLLGAGPATISASVGITASEPGDDADALLSRADAAMYVAKRSGGGRCVLAD